jgi:AhpD family alkylhydroperoxidase
MKRTTLRTTLLLALAVPVGVTGVWALAAPASWYADFPGFGRHWVASLGPYNEHLARDFGGAYLALATLLAIAAAAPSVSLARAVPAAFLLFASPHLAFHVVHAGTLPTGDDMVNLVLLGLSVVVPIGLLALRKSEPMRARAAPGPSGWRLTPAKSRNPFVLVAQAIVRRRFGHVIGPFAITAHHPPLLAGYTAFELALENSNRIDRQLEELAGLRAATLTGCPFCIDFGSALVAQVGVSEEHVRDISRWRESTVYSEDERLVLEYAEEMTRTPVEVSDELFERLRARFGEGAIVELTAAIAFENYRGRFNHAVGLGQEGFCAVAPATNGRPASRLPMAG